LDYLLPLRPFLFPAGPCGLLLRCRPPFSCESEFILSYVYRLFRVRDRSKPAQTTEVPGLPSLECPSPSRHETKEFTFLRAFHGSHSGPPSAFLTLSTVCSSLDLASLFHPAATSGIHLSGVFPAAQLGRLVGGPCPLVVRLRSSHPRVAPRIPTPGTPPSGFCSKQRSVANNRGFSPIHCPFPS